MKKIVSIMIICLFIAAVGCKPKKSKNRFAKGPIAKQTIIADVQAKLGGDYTVLKVTRNKKYEKDGNVKAKVHLKAKKADGAKENFKLIYSQKDGKWELSNIYKNEGKEWKKIQGDDDKDAKDKKDDDKKADKKTKSKK